MDSISYEYINDNYVVSINKLPEKPINKTRFIFISDTHEQHKTLTNFINGDVVIHCGDILVEGRKYSDEEALEKYQNFHKWIMQLNCSHRIIIGGNHDPYLEKIGVIESKKIFSNCHYLYNEFFQIMGFTFFASPFNIGHSQNNAFQSYRIFEDMNIKTKNKKIDFLLTHGHLRHTFFSDKQIRYHIWGHLHTHYGVYYVKHTNTLSVCASSLDENYVLIHKPIIMDL